LKNKQTDVAPDPLDQSPVDSNEADQIWDEYKYRHDLIWRHLIRSTVAVIALITVGYSTAFTGHKMLFFFSALLAFAYSIFNLIVINSELKHYWKVRDQHAEFQRRRFGFCVEQEETTNRWTKWRRLLSWSNRPRRVRGFAGRVNAYLVVLLAISVVAIFDRINPQFFPALYDDIFPNESGATGTTQLPTMHLRD